MMTADQCRAKAEDFDRQAEDAVDNAAMLECEDLATAWRWVERQAEWQDAWEGQWKAGV